MQAGQSVINQLVSQSVRPLKRQSKPSLLVEFVSTSMENELQSKQQSPPKSRFMNLIRHYSLQISTTFKLKERCKTTQVHALNPREISATASSSKSNNKHKDQQHNQGQLTINSILSNSSDTSSVSAVETLLPYGLPTADLLEPPVDPHLISIDYVQSLADLYRRVEGSSEFDKSLIYLQQYSLLCSFDDPKLLRRCLQLARRHAVDVHSKVVLSAWLRYERREAKLGGTSPLDCIGRILECPKSALVHGYDPSSVFYNCRCCHPPLESFDNGISSGNECLSAEENGNVCFCIGNEEVNCVRHKIAALSAPLKSMLYGDFIESKKERIDFSSIGISVDGMEAVNSFSSLGRLVSCFPNVVLELLSFANRFCCEEMKSVCDNYLASLIYDIEDALLLIEYGLEERANLLVGSCLQVFLRELPSNLHNPKVMNLFCSSESRERLSMVGHASFLLYYFLSQVAIEEDMTSKMTVRLLERLRECAIEKWQKALALHQFGCVLLMSKEYKEAEQCFEEAANEGHVYSVAGIARCKYKQEQRFSAYELIDSLISEYGPTGWMYQERSFYNLGKNKILDLNEATKLDPTLSFAYKYRAVAMVAENRIEAAISEINRIIGFKVTPDCLELRAWIFIVLEDYEAALRDVRALLTLEPNYMMFHGKMRGDHLVDLLCQDVHQWSPADCWLQLYERWSSVDDIGSLAVIHQMLMNSPGNSILRFRQSLLLLRLNCQKAAMQSLRLARNNSSSEHERLVYEGWILYDNGYREEALSKSQRSISIQRSFEAFFLKAYVLSDTEMDPASASYAIELLEEALRCPSDGLRKGQALYNLGIIYVDCGKLDLAANCYINALDIKHTRAHQGLARVYHLKNDSQAAYDEMTKMIEKAQSKASAYEKRAEFSDRDLANYDLSIATQLNPLRTHPYRYRAAALMDDLRETEAVTELTKALAFKPDLQTLHLRAAFLESMGDLVSALQDCEAALCLDPNHKNTLELYNRTRDQYDHQRT